MGEGERKGRKKRLVSHHGNLTAGLPGITHTSVLGASSGVAKAGPGWAHAQSEFIPLMCAQALVLLAQWLAYSRCPANTNDLAMPLGATVSPEHSL